MASPHGRRRDRGLFVVNALVDSYNYSIPSIFNNNNHRRVAVVTELNEEHDAPLQVRMVDKYAFLTKIAIGSAIAGVVAISIGQQPHCADGCQKKSCSDSPIDDDDYGGTLQTKTGRCVCHADDGSEYCARQQQTPTDQYLYFGALACFGIAFLAFLVRFWIAYACTPEMRVGRDRVPSTEAVVVVTPSVEAVIQSDDCDFDCDTISAVEMIPATFRSLSVMTTADLVVGEAVEGTFATGGLSAPPVPLATTDPAPTANSAANYVELYNADNNV